MGWFIGVLAVGIVALGAGYDRKRQRERSRVSRPEINRWEEEGGSVQSGEPVEPAARPTTH
jgi:hypothetical protein